MLKSTFEITLDRAGLIAVLKTAELINPNLSSTKSISVYVTIDGETKAFIGEDVIKVEGIT